MGKVLALSASSSLRPLSAVIRRVLGNGSSWHVRADQRPSWNCEPVAMPDRLTVDVVIPVYRPGPWLDTCIASVLASEEVDVRVYVVDDDPERPTATLVQAAEGDVTVITLGANYGFAAACNRGIGAGSSPFVLCLNQDAAIRPDFLRRLGNRLLGDPSLAVIGGKMLHQPSPNVPPDGLLDSCGLEMRRGRRCVDIGQGEVDVGQYDGYREVFGVCAAAALFRRRTLIAIWNDGEVFDEAFFMHKEDVDLAWRLQAAGYRAAIDSSAIGYHARGVRRAGDLQGRGPRQLLTAVVRTLAQERAKPSWIRHLAWRNQLLMLIKNEEPDDFVRSASDILAYQLAQLAAGLLVDPVATVRSRASFFRLIRPALRGRRRRRAPRASVSRWLP